VARNGGFENVAEGFFDHGDAARVPVRYLAALLAGGDESSVRDALRKQQAVRWHRRAATVGDVDAGLVQRRLAEADCSPEQAEAIYRLTSLASAAERFVLPPASREEAIEATEHPLAVKQRTGFGFVAGPRKD
jgi:nitrate reductase / nitrite oxidoreductase, beta subunit